MTVYWDVLLLTNLLMDFLMLLAAARLGAIWVKRWRLLLAALIGGGYSVVALICPVLAVWPLRILVGGGLCWIGYGEQPAFWRVCALYYLVSAAFAGGAIALGAVSGHMMRLGVGYYFSVPIRILLLAAVLGYVISGVVLQEQACYGVLRRRVARLRIRQTDGEQFIKVLCDSGNTLCEPITGYPAVIVSQMCAARLLGEQACWIENLSKDNAADCLAAMPSTCAAHFGLLKYTAIGTKQGLLLYFRPEGEIQDENGRLVRCVFAISPQRMLHPTYDGLMGV